MLQADPLRDREISFTFEGEKYKAKFKAKGGGWAIFNERGIICPELAMPELWMFFRDHYEPEETKPFKLFDKK